MREHTANGSSDDHRWKASQRRVGNHSLPRRDVLRGAGSLALLTGASFGGFASERVRGESTQSACEGREMAFIDRLYSTANEPALTQDDWFVWGADVIRDDNGAYHMFAARWPHSSGFDGWGSESEIVHATADTPEGPFSVDDTAIEAWAHNPAITRADDGTYLLYYLGDGGVKVATSESPDTSWTIHETGAPGPGNPAAVQRDEGDFLLITKAGDPDLGRRYDVWLADEYDGTYERVNQQVFDRTPPEGPVEDVEIWKSNGIYHMLSNWGSLSGFTEKSGGFHAVSRDGIVWDVPDNALAFDHHITYENGTSDDPDDIERVKVLIQDGVATHMYNAFSYLNKGSDEQNDGDIAKGESTWNIVTPLRTPKDIEIKPDEKTAKIDPGSEENIPVKIHQTDGFNPRTDVRIDSLRFGSFDAVNRGCGSEPIRTTPPSNVNASPGDLVVHFPNEGHGFQETAADYGGKLVGKTTDGELLFGWDTVTIVGPDLTIAAEEFSVEGVGGQTKRFTVPVKNQGTETSSQTTVALLDVTDDSPTLITSLDVQPLESEETAKFSYDWNIESVPQGIYDIQAVIDPNNDVLESTEVNNSSPVIRTAVGSNLSVDGLALSKKREGTIEIRAKIGNEGSKTANEGQVRLVNSTAEEVEIASPTVPSLEPQESTEVVYTWDREKMHNVVTVKAIVDPDNQVDEYDEADNEATTTKRVGPEPTMSADSLYSSGYPARNAIDLDVETWWNSAEADGMPHWLQADLSESEEIEKVVVWNRRDDSPGGPYHIRALDVLTKNGTSEFTVQGSARDVSTETDPIVVEFDQSATADQIRIDVLRETSDIYNDRHLADIAELEVWNSKGVRIV